MRLQNKTNGPKCARARDFPLSLSCRSRDKKELGRERGKGYGAMLPRNERSRNGEKKKKDRSLVQPCSPSSAWPRDERVDSRRHSAHAVHTHTHTRAPRTLASLQPHFREIFRLGHLKLPLPFSCSSRSWRGLLRRAFRRWRL